MAAAAPNPLRGKISWLTGPSGAVNVGVGTIVVVYSALTMTLPEGSVVPLAIVVALVAAVLVPTSFVLYARWLRTVSRLGRGAFAPAPGELAAAAKEAARLPDRLFWVVAAFWTCGVSAAIPGLHFAVHLELDVVMRLALNAWLIAPIGALLAYFLALNRARRLCRQLTELGLGADELVRALPPTRMQLRARLVLLCAVMVISPAGITANLAITVLQQGMDQVRAAADAASRAAAAATAVDQALLSVGLLGALVLAFVLAVAYAGGSALGAPLRVLAADAQRVAAGDLRAAPLVPAEDELWSLSIAFHRMRAQLKRVLSELGRAGERIGGATQQLTAVADQTRVATHGQATALEQTSTNTRDVAGAAQQIASNAAQVARSAADTLGSSEHSQERSRAFAEAMKKLQQDNQAVRDAVSDMQQRVQRIGRIVEFINGVADKADLLALNAELEGTKAGEIGRGFSLVAGEVRRMAEQVTAATKEIEAHIGKVRQAGGSAATASAEAAETTALGQRLAQDLSGSLARIFKLAQETARAAGQISSATGMQRTSSEELAAAMANALEITQTEAASTAQIAQAATDLAALSARLGTAVQKFEVA